MTSAPPPASRGERKELTRRAILDAALRLSRDTPLTSLSLRQVAREAGIVPTAFYRHFDSVEQLGLALVDEAVDSLRAMLRDVRRPAPAFADVIDSSMAVLRDHVARRHDHFAFIARERSAGPPRVRVEIRHRIELFEHELATDLSRLPGTSEWSVEDLQVLAGLIVSASVATVEDLIAADGRADAEDRVVQRARTQLRMLLVGALNWRPRAAD